MVVFTLHMLKGIVFLAGEGICICDVLMGDGYRFCPAAVIAELVCCVPDASQIHFVSGLMQYCNGFSVFGFCGFKVTLFCEV